MRKIADLPSDVAADGRGGRFWRSVLDHYVLREDEMEVLTEACRLLDLVDALNAAVTADGPVVGGKPHPALVELRQVRQELRRSLAALTLPDEDGHDGLAKSRAGRRAAQVRWASRGA